MYGRSYGGRELTFEASGALWQASLVMRDRETDSWWSIMTSEAIGGEMEGADLVELPVAEKATWGDWRSRHPDTLALTVDGRQHEPRNPYRDYFANDRTFRGLEVADQRLPPKAPIFGFFLDGRARAVPHAAVEGGRLVSLDGGDGEGVRLLFHRRPGASMFASTSAWRLADGAEGTAGELVTAARAGGDGFEPLTGIDTFWYNWVAVNQDSELLP